MTRLVVARPVHIRHSPRSNTLTPTAELPDVCRQYRRAVRGAGIACPAEVVWTPELANWVRTKGVAVEARSSAELSLALSAGIPPSRIIMHCVGAQAGPIRCAVNARVAQFVVESGWQADVLGHYTRDRRRVLVDLTSPRAESAVDAVLVAGRLDLVGLHRQVDDVDSYAEVVSDMMARMAHIRSERGVLLTRLSLAGPVSASPRRVGADVDDALDDACARWRLPRPGVTLALLWPIVRPR